LFFLSKAADSAAAGTTARNIVTASRAGNAPPLSAALSQSGMRLG